MDQSSRAVTGDAPNRIKRARQACLQCRTTKRRCRPAPSKESCWNCLEDEILCEWPGIDGRSMRPKRKWREHSPGPLTSQTSRHVNPEEPVLPTTSISPKSTLTAGPSAGGPNKQRSTSFTSESLTVRSVPSVLPAALNTQSSVLSPLASAETQLSFFNGSPEQTSSLQDSDFTSFLMSLGVDPSEYDQPEPASASREGRHNRESSRQNRMVRTIWSRPHGLTAIAPGLQRLTLKIQVEGEGNYQQGRYWFPLQSVIPLNHALFDEHGLPTTEIMTHLLDIFMRHFGCQFPVLDPKRLHRQIQNRTGSVLLMNCIAATASRFSEHPLLKFFGQEPYEYGNPFLSVARQLLGSVLSVPSRDTIMALVMFAGLGHGIDSESEEWMMAGMAVRMALDLGLHLEPVAGLNTSSEDQRLNRLTFWSVCMLDFALCYGTGRPTTFRVPEITQKLPSATDILPSAMGVSSPFPHAARQMFLYGDLINALNGPHDEQGLWLQNARSAMSKAMESYQSLPSYMQWGPANFKQQAEAQQGSIFVQLHLWMHTVTASAYLTDSDILDSPGPLNDEVIPRTEEKRWASSSRSARSIVDILTLMEAVDPFAYHALPFANQAFFTAGSCLIKEIESGIALSAQTDSPTSQLVNIEDNGHLPIISSIAANIASVRKALAKQATFWVGVAWVRDALEERILGASTGEIDLNKVTGLLPSYVTVPDAGVVEEDVATERVIEVTA